MRGKHTFSRREAAKIREFLIRIGNASDKPHTQQRLRMLIRKKYGFYISDFDVDTGGKRFTEADFDALEAVGKITVLDLDFNDRACIRHSGSWNEGVRERYSANLRDLPRSKPGEITAQHACAICAYERGRKDGARELARKIAPHLSRFL